MLKVRGFIYRIRFAAGGRREGGERMGEGESGCARSSTICIDLSMHVHVVKD